MITTSNARIEELKAENRKLRESNRELKMQLAEAFNDVDKLETVSHSRRLLLESLVLDLQGIDQTESNADDLRALSDSDVYESAKSVFKRRMEGRCVNAVKS